MKSPYCIDRSRRIFTAVTKMIPGCDLFARTRRVVRCGQPTCITLRTMSGTYAITTYNHSGRSHTIQQVYPAQSSSCYLSLRISHRYPLNVRPLGFGPNQVEKYYSLPNGFRSPSLKPPRHQSSGLSLRPVQSLTVKGGCRGVSDGMMLIKKPAVSLGGITIVRAHLGTLARVAQKNARLIAYNGRPAADHLRIHNITNSSGKDGIRRGYSPGSSTLQLTEVTEVMRGHGIRSYKHNVFQMGIRSDANLPNLAQDDDRLSRCMLFSPASPQEAGGNFRIVGSRTIGYNNLLRPTRDRPYSILHGLL